MHERGNLLHHIMDIKSDIYGKVHLICVIDAHSQQSLHCLEFVLICLSYLTPIRFIDELDYSIRHLLIFSKDRPYHEVLNISSTALVVQLINELAFFLSIVGYEDCSWREYHSRDSWVSREVHEFLLMHFFNLIYLLTHVNFYCILLLFLLHHLCHLIQ